MRQYFQELHQGQADRGESGWIWKHLSEEMLEKEKPSCGLGHPEDNQGTGEGERASGSMDHRSGGSPPTSLPRHQGASGQGPGEQIQEEEESRKRPRSTEQEAPQEA
eukprot:8588171-Heterocapsa_arctica.AAC.1